MLYPKNSRPLTGELFQNPTSEYRGAPFWAWNNKLDAKELAWQIEQLKLMGLGGFHMHVRTGMDTEYLSDEYMEVIKACVEKAREEEMLAWLYDEDRWPSGAAGGIVTQNPEYRARRLRLSRKPEENGGGMLARYDVRLDGNGNLAEYRVLGENEAARGFALYAFEETEAPSPWFNNQTYVNTLDPAAIREFIKVTHEKYAKCIPEYFGNVVPAIFTDEPQFTRKQTLSFAGDASDVILPWTTDLPETYQAAYGENIFAAIPELLWDLPGGKPSAARYRYHDHIAERFASAFADQIGTWCAAHGIMLTGHMMEESTLLSQTAALGDAMRSYRSFQLPGIDMLCDWREFTTAKQAQSAARQFGREGVLSELYGVTNWDFDFRGHKLQGDWQAALGVTVRVPHLSWVSMNGEAKRDYPASINYQSPWYREYPYIENHFARVNTAMTRGKAVCRVGVVHPVESYWLHWGASETTAAIRNQMEENFHNVTNWLLRGLIDFDFISESLLPGQCEIGDISEKGFPVGEMRYDAVVVPAMETIRSTTLERLEAFRGRGGRVIFLEEAPRLVDARPDGGAGKLFERAERIPFEKYALLSALEDLRRVEIRSSSGEMTDGLFAQLREEDDCLWLFVAHADAAPDEDNPRGDMIRIKIRGEYGVTLYDTLNGEILPVPAESADGWTTLRHPLYEHDSLLLKLDKGAGNKAPAPAVSGLVNSSAEGKTRFLGPVPVTLGEPNVLLLDMAEYSLDGEPYRKREEILRLDNILRGELNWPKRSDAVAQPWVEKDETTPHKLRLRFTFRSGISVKGAELALENAGTTAVTLNGAPAGAANGWYADKCIGKLPLPEIAAGENVLELTLPYGRKTDVEACCLLGDFGVIAAGCVAALTDPVKALRFGDITRQGLPFYGGNITYRLEAETQNNGLEIAATCYRGSLLRVSVDGKDAGAIAFSPYRLTIGGLAPGKHNIDVTYFGTRVNTFGQLHRNDRKNPWWGPNSWRTEGSAWTYEYRFWPQGILKSPEIF